jgi:hypothetical protein
MFSGRSESSAAVTGAIVIGRIGARSFDSTDSTPNCRRQVQSWLALRSCRRAISAIDVPSSRLSSTIRRFSSVVHDRRFPPQLRRILVFVGRHQR